jgi:hypothetical protein
VARFDAIHETLRAITRLLRESYNPGILSGRELEFEVYRSPEFESPMGQGLSLFLYRVDLHELRRNPVRHTEDGAKRTQLPLELHFLLTPWAPNAFLQHAILGWAMTTLADYPILSSGYLNETDSGAFSEGENVEITPVPSTTEELVRIWDRVNAPYEVSMTYVARVVRLESPVDRTVAPLVSEVRHGYGPRGAGT